MASLLKTTLIAGLALANIATAQATAQTTPVAAAIDPQLVGTWSTKSNKVFTGPGFYDPVNEKMFEPDLTGISYSFTADGYYEEAYYRAISNPTQPQCPQGIMQFQHGTFIQDSANSLHLTPFAVDGRQLLSNPCQYSNSVYTRYNQSEVFKKFEVILDPYHNIQRLNLFKFDGSPMNPMYLAYKPPQMLPTQTLNPTTAKSSKGAQATSKNKVKRTIDDPTISIKTNEPINADKWWWIGLGMTGIGAVGYFCF